MLPVDSGTEPVPPTSTPVTGARASDQFSLLKTNISVCNAPHLDGSDGSAGPYSRQTHRTMHIY